MWFRFGGVTPSLPPLSAFGGRGGLWVTSPQGSGFWGPQWQFLKRGGAKPSVGNMLSTWARQCRGAVVKLRTRRAVHRLDLWAGSLSTAGASANHVPRALFLYKNPVGDGSGDPQGRAQRGPQGPQARACHI